MPHPSAHSMRMDQKWVSQEEFEAKTGMVRQADALFAAYSQKSIKASILAELSRKQGARFAARFENSAKRRKLSLRALLKKMSDKAKK